MSTKRPPVGVPEQAWRGMRQPRSITLAPLARICRFSSSTTPWPPHAPMPDALHVASPWWMWQRDLPRIEARADRTRMTLGFTARMGAAVQQGWHNRMDRLVKAVVLEDLPAYDGTPRTQYEDPAPNGIVVTMRGDPQLVQLYIPGLQERDGDGKPRATALARRALIVQSIEEIPSFQMW